MNVDVSKAIALALPAISLVFKNLPASTNPWVSLLQKLVLMELEQVARQAAPAALQAYLPVQHRFGLPATVVKPPESEWNEAGLERWSKAQIQSMP